MAMCVQGASTSYSCSKPFLLHCESTILLTIRRAGRSVDSWIPEEDCNLIVGWILFVFHLMLLLWFQVQKLCQKLCTCARNPCHRKSYIGYITCSLLQHLETDCMQDILTCWCNCPISLQWSCMLYVGQFSSQSLESPTPLFESLKGFVVGFLRAHELHPAFAYSSAQCFSIVVLIVELNVLTPGRGIMWTVSEFQWSMENVCLKTW